MIFMVFGMVSHSLHIFYSNFIILRIVSFSNDLIRLNKFHVNFSSDFFSSQFPIIISIYFIFTELPQNIQPIFDLIIYMW